MVSAILGRKQIIHDGLWRVPRLGVQATKPMLGVSRYLDVSTQPLSGSCLSHPAVGVLLNGSCFHVGHWQFYLNTICLAVSQSQQGNATAWSENKLKHLCAVLKACSGSKNLANCRRIHVNVVESGLELDLRLGTMLLDAYAKCGGLLEARQVFEKMPQHDVVSWTAMIFGYAQMAEGETALELFARMQQEGVVPNDRTYVAALKACNNLETDDITEKKLCLKQVQAIHRQVVRSGSQSLHVGNMLVHAYASCGSLVEARRVFDHMPNRTVVSWTTMISGYAQMAKGKEALDLYERMLREGVAPNDRTFVAALKACGILASTEEAIQGHDIAGKEQCLERVRRIHAQVGKKGSEVTSFVSNTLVDVYAKCGSLADARQVFESMPDPDVVSWTALIIGYAQMEEGEVALQLYAKMLEKGVMPDDRAFVGAIKACDSLVTSAARIRNDENYMKIRCLEQLRDIHSHIVKYGHKMDVILSNMLVDVYSKCGSLGTARRVFENMPHRNVVSWNVLISGYANTDEADEALKLYTRMQQENVAPDERTFVAVLKACISLIESDKGREANGRCVDARCLAHVRAIHSQVVTSTAQSDIYVGNMLLDAYAKCGSLVDARSVFENMSRRDAATWSAMILGHAQVEEGAVALQFYTQMQQEGFEPDGFAFVGALKACGSLSALDQGREVHARILKAGSVDSFVASSLIDMYGKCGSMVDAQRVFDSLPMRDTVTWTALIAGYSHLGESDVVFDLFQTMRQEGVQPNGVTFLAVLTVCSHVGLVDEGQTYFKSMCRDFGLSPAIQHYTCMIDLFARAGQLQDAVSMTKSMPFPPDSAIWQTILAACQKWRNAEIGRQAFECAVRLDRNDAAAYALMSNIYASCHLWEASSEIEAMRVASQTRKQQGRSQMFDTKGGVHSFGAGHPMTYLTDDGIVHV